MRERHIYAAVDCLKKGKFGWLSRQIIKYLSIPVSYYINKPLTGPITASLLPTYRCNSKCKMCDLGLRGSREEELGLNEWYRIIDELIKLNVSGFAITGGEPLLRKQTIDLIRYIGRSGLPIHLSTNGYLMDEAMASSLLEAGLTTISVSIDSADPKKNDQLRGMDGAHSMALKAIRTIDKARRNASSHIRLTIGAVLSKQTIDEIDSLCRLTQESGADKISFVPVTLSGLELNKDIRTDLLKVTPEDSAIHKNAINKLLEYEKAGIIDNSRTFIHTLDSYFNSQPFPYGCFIGYTGVMIGADGKVFPCLEYLQKTISVGSVRNSSIIDIWRSEEYAELRKTLSQCRDCYWGCHQELNLLYHYPLTRLSNIGKVFSKTYFTK